MRNFESLHSIDDLGLTSIEAHQTRTKLKSESYYQEVEKEKGLIEIIKFFQDNPEKRKTITEDPFNRDHDDIYLEASLAQSKMNIIRAALLAEPEGSYERAFSALPKKEKVDKLYDQIEDSAEMTLRIERYVEHHLQDISQTSDRDLYRKLCEVAFETHDEKEIESNFALSQRRGFRLGIIDFLTKRSALLGRKEEIDLNQKAFAEKYLGEQFTGDVSIEQLPFAIIIYLDEQDYALVDNPEHSIQNMTSQGLTLFDKTLPKELQGNLIVMNKGGKEKGIKSKDNLDSTKKHELRHVIFKNFHQQTPEPFNYDIEKSIDCCLTEQDYHRFSSDLSQAYVELAKDEIIAYASTGDFHPSFFGLGFEKYQRKIDLIEKYLRIKGMPEERLESIIGIFIKDQVSCFETIKKIKLVAEQMHRTPNTGLVKKLFIKLGITREEVRKDIAEVLLRNTSGTNVHRLARYAGLSEDKLRGNTLIKEEEQKATVELSMLSNMPKVYNPTWAGHAEQVLRKVEKQLPRESLPVILKTLLQLSEQDKLSPLVSQNLWILKDFVKLFKLNKPEKQKIKEVLDSISQRTLSKNDDFREALQGYIKEIIADIEI
jgi:NACalpha-BTF3-like transcription factor